VAHASTTVDARGARAHHVAAGLRPTRRAGVREGGPAPPQRLALELGVETIRQLGLVGAVEGVDHERVEHREREATVAHQAPPRRGGPGGVPRDVAPHTLAQRRVRREQREEVLRGHERVDAGEAPRRDRG
jgi:hypothetical protein